MLHQTENEERTYLSEVQGKLRAEPEQINQKIDNHSKEVLETKRYIYKNLAQLDSTEKAVNRTAVYDSVAFGEKAVGEREKLEKLIQSLYFRRVDFIRTEGEQGNAFYIGAHAFADLTALRSAIFDWRVPVSSMLCDFETGPAFYKAPAGKIDGVMTLKWQYRIRQTQMEYMIESSLSIDDEIPQKELSRDPDNKMKNIVTTIQREQNAIIRNEAAKALIIQGVASSGKTSIALHRIAFLLYRFKDTLTSKNILIISPNKVFGNYISNVLSELGEEDMSEIGFDDIAADMFGKKYRYQTFSEQVESLLVNGDAETIARIEFKATDLFVEQLQSYLESADKTCFVPTDPSFKNFSISKGELLLDYRASEKLSIKTRSRKIADDLIERYKRDTN